MLCDLKSQTREELSARFKDWGQAAYRVDQLLAWLYVQRVTDWEMMTNLPKPLREQLRQNFTLQSLELVRKQGAHDSTQKFLWRLSDQSLIESVLIPANPALYGEASDRHTLCVSTQVGCAYGCKFCASGLEGWKRNLRADEIVEQVLAVERWHALESPKSVEESSEFRVSSSEANSELETRNSELENPTENALVSQTSDDGGTRNTRPASSRLINNLVIMGMGEPLANYDQLVKALEILNATWGGGIGARKITVSTSGLAPQIRKLAEEPMQFRLAISLHGATDETRNKIMPVNRKYPLNQLIAACEYYQKKKGRMITLEYILIAGVNDRLDECKPLASLAHRLHAKVNLIPYNNVEGLTWERPSEQAQEDFLAALEKQKVTATLRREKGHDIDAACGQLRLKTEVCAFQQSMIALLDYGSGNLRSVEKALRKVGAEVRLVTGPEGMKEARAAVLPGVGAFDDCVTAMQKQELLGGVKDFIASGRPFLGICVGYQALFEKSEEFNSCAAGLGIFRGKVVRFSEQPGLKIPQIGWNQLEIAQPECPLFRGIAKSSYVYFVHSFFPRPEDSSIIAARTVYGESFASAIWRENVFATQFHPEKSQAIGLKLLRNFVELSGNSVGRIPAPSIS